MYMCMRIYVRVYVHILMYADIWTYNDNTNILTCAYIFVGVGGVSAILTLPPSLFIAFHFIHCIINLLCTLMLYICDWSTLDLNEEDKVNWTAVTGEYMGNNCWHQNRIKHRETDALLKWGLSSLANKTFKSKISGSPKVVILDVKQRYHIAISTGVSAAVTLTSYHDIIVLVNFQSVWPVVMFEGFFLSPTSPIGCHCPY